MESCCVTNMSQGIRQIQHRGVRTHSNTFRLTSLRTSKSNRVARKPIRINAQTEDFFASVPTGKEYVAPQADNGKAEPSVKSTDVSATTDDFFASVPTGENMLKEFYAANPSPFLPPFRKNKSSLVEAFEEAKKDLTHPMPSPEVAGAPLASPTVRKTDLAVLGVALLGAVTESLRPDGALTRSLRRLKMQKKEKVGSGSVGYVYRAVYKDKTDVAVKVLTEEALRVKNNRKRFKAEMEIWKPLNHPNIVRVLHTSTQPVMMLVTEFCSEGRLLKYLQLGRSWIKEVCNVEEGLGNATCDGEVDLKQVMMDVGRGLEYLHNEGVIHGDVKSANVMLSAGEDGRMVAKLCDFGSATLAEADPDSQVTVPAGTLLWMPPEILNKDLMKNPYMPANDVFSFGMLIYELLVQGIPWTYAGAEVPKGREEIVQVVVEERQRPFIPTWVPFSLSTLLKQMWAHSPYDRPSIQEVLAALQEIDSDDWDFIQKCAYHNYEMSTVKGSGDLVYPAVLGEWNAEAADSETEVVGGGDGGVVGEEAKVADPEANRTTAELDYIVLGTPKETDSFF